MELNTVPQMIDQVQGLLCGDGMQADSAVAEADSPSTHCVLSSGFQSLPCFSPSSRTAQGDPRSHFLPVTKRKPFSRFTFLSVSGEQASWGHLFCGSLNRNAPSLPVCLALGSGKISMNIPGSQPGPKCLPHLPSWDAKLCLQCPLGVKPGATWTLCGGQKCVTSPKPSD